jgi:hypothetical protein
MDGMSVEPKPCPFCGGEPEPIKNKAIPSATAFGCGNCGTCGPFSDSRNDGAAAWNRLAYVPEGWRVVPEELTEGMDAAIGEAIDNGFTTLDLWDDVLAAAPKPEDGQE